MPEGLAIGEGIAKGLEKATSNMLNIFYAKEELRRERELFDIKKKQSGLEMKKLETEVSPDMLDLLKRKQKVEVETAEVDLEAKEVTLEQSRKSITDTITELQDTAKTLNLPGYGDEQPAGGATDFTLPEGWSFETEVGGGKLKIGGQKELTAHQQQEREATRNKAESWLAGTAFDDIEPPETKQQAYWGLKSFGENPDDYDLSDFPDQEEVYGKPAGGGRGAAKGIMRVFPGFTKSGAFMADIPAGKGAAKVKTKYKAGDTKVIDGITYKRNEKGQWLPQ